MPASKLPVDTSADAVAMANEIFGLGATVVGASYSGDSRSSGIYSDGDATSPAATPGDRGVILSTGRAQDYTNTNGQENQLPNTSTNTAGSNAGFTFDRAILDVDFIPDAPLMTVQLVFASEEYPEFVNGIYQDFVNVSVNGVPADLEVGNGDIDPGNLNAGVNQNQFIDNTGDAVNTEMDGLTITLTLTMNVNPGVVNSIRFEIADVADSSFDSNLLIAAESAQTALIAVSDYVTMSPNGSVTVDVLDNDIAASGGSLLQITHINDQPVSAGSIVTLPTGQQVQLNADATLTIIGDGDIEDYSFTYKTDDFFVQDTGFVHVTTVVPCFVVGTMVRTPDGEVAVEKLKPGDMVITRDDGPQPLRWIGQRQVRAEGDLAPIRIRAGTFGKHRQIMVSPQHRILLKDRMAELLFGEGEVLVAAKHLLSDHSVTRVCGGFVTYVHLMFDKHQVIYTQDLETESFLPGPQTSSVFDQEAIREICTIFPELDPHTGEGYGGAARRMLREYETRLLLNAQRVA